MEEPGCRGAVARLYSMRPEIFLTADHGLDGTCLVVNDCHSRLRLNDFLFETVVLCGKFISVLNKEIRVVFEELRTYHQIVFGVAALVLLRNIDVAARDRVELAVFSNAVHALLSSTLYAVGPPTVCIVDSKALACEYMVREPSSFHLIFAGSQLETNRRFADVVAEYA